MIAGVRGAGIQLSFTVLACPLHFTVTLIVIGQISTRAMNTRVISAVVYVDFAVHTCKTRHTVTSVAPFKIMTQALVLARVGGTFIGLGFTPETLITIGTGTGIFVNSIFT